MLELGLLAMEAAWRKNMAGEPRQFVRLMNCMPVRLMRIALWKVCMLPEDLRPSAPPAMPLHDSLGLSEQECRRYVRLARFVQHLDLMSCGGSPEDLLAAVEWTPQDVGGWLKVAGGDKAVVLWDQLQSRPKALHEVTVEFGTLVGYTAIRLGAICSATAPEQPQHAQCPHVVTVELDACHACVSRHAIDLAGLSQGVEVWIGQVRDLVPRLVEEFGSLSVGFLFMDHKSTAFHEDLQQAEVLGVLGVGSVVAANSCLKPGAPFLLWHVTVSSAYSAVIWSVRDFAAADMEDWLAVCQHVGCPPCRPSKHPPQVGKVLSQLTWEAEHLRAGAEAGELQPEDWLAFSQYARSYLALLGIEARPWQGPLGPESHRRDAPLDSRQLAELWCQDG